MAQVPIDRLIHNPDAIKIANIIMEFRPGPDGKFDVVVDPSFPDRVSVRSVLFHQTLKDAGEDGKRAVENEARTELFNAPMSDAVRKLFFKAFNAYRDELASMYLKPDNGKELVFDGDKYVETKIAAADAKKK